MSHAEAVAILLSLTFLSAVLIVSIAVFFGIWR